MFVSSQKYFDAVRSKGNGETGNNLTVATLTLEFRFTMRRNFLVIGKEMGLYGRTGSLWTGIIEEVGMNAYRLRGV